MVIERFAPSPTGYLHLGHAYSAMTAWRSTKTHSGKFLIRIEDLDSTRSKSQYTQAIFDDLSRLGINWNIPVVYQSERYSVYEDCLSKWDFAFLANVLERISRIPWKHQMLPSFRKVRNCFIRVHAETDPLM